MIPGTDQPLEGRPIPDLLPGSEYEVGRVEPRGGGKPYVVSIRRTGEGFFDVLARVNGRPAAAVRGPFDRLEDAVAAGEHLILTGGAWMAAR